MQIDTRYGQYWDQQAVAQFSILHRLDDSPMKSFAESWLIDHLARLDSGRRMAAKDHPSIEYYLRQVDRNLKLRYDYDQGMYAIDRFVPEYGYHFVLFYWSHQLGEGTALREILRESDMQRPEYLRQKKIAQELIQERNEKLRTEMALESVDGLTEERRKEFIAVERAMQTGEKIHVRGADAEIMNRMYEDTKKRDAEAWEVEHQMRMNGQDVQIVPDQPQTTSMMPHTHPRRLKHKFRFGDFSS